MVEPTFLLYLQVAEFSVRSNQDILPNSTLSSKYGHFLPQNSNGTDVQLSRKTVNKPVGDITVGLHLLYTQ